jgi:hypothetical protein
MKRCGYCGHENDDSKTVCGGCGLEISDAAAALPKLFSKRTTVIAVIVGCLFFAIAGRYSPLLAPAVISWIIIASARNSKRTAQFQILCGVAAILLLLVQIPILVVILMTFEEYGEATARNPSALALIAMFVVCLASVVGYIGRLLRPQLT